MQVLRTVLSFTAVCVVPCLAIAADTQPVEAPTPVVDRETETLRQLAPMPFEIARERTFAFAATAGKDDSALEAVREIWASSEPGIPSRSVHELTILSISAVNEDVRQLFSGFDLRNPPLIAPELLLVDDLNDSFARTNVMLAAARFLAEARMYDEAHTLFVDADLTLAIDPASALFFQAVCEHQLLMRQEGLDTIDTLLERTAGVSESHIIVARLMRAELEALEDDSLDEIAAMMRDVGRRLELARGGQKVQKKEEEITSKLDELIEKIEQQMNQSSSSGSSNGNQNDPSSPLDESVVKGSTAPGNVDPKDVRREGGWGDLPRREREQAKNEMEKAFPSNYGRLINEYFLKRTRGDRPAGE